MIMRRHKIMQTFRTVKSPNESQVIQGYLNGKSREQNVRENNVSTGTVSNIIENWAREIGLPDIKEMRLFAVLVKKSGVPSNIVRKALERSN
jgi:hypothetical protein